MKPDQGLAWSTSHFPDDLEHLGFRQGLVERRLGHVRYSTNGYGLPHYAHFMEHLDRTQSRVCRNEYASPSSIMAQIKVEAKNWGLVGAKHLSAIMSGE